MMGTAQRYDVVILGGGAAGLTLALQLRRARPGVSLLVLERSGEPAPEAAHKVGESTVEVAAHYLRDVLGLGDHLKGRQLRKFGLRCFFSDGENRDIARRVELGHTVYPPHGVSTYQLDRGRLENALTAELPSRGIDHVYGAKVDSVELRPEEDVHLVHVHDGEESRTVEARWVVDATGRSSLLKRQLGLAKTVGHHANAAWFRIGYPVDIDTWSDDEAWHSRLTEGERRLSTNHLMGPGYWVWLIPLASESISIGIVTDPRLQPFNTMNTFERALAWLDENEPQCADVVHAHRDQLQDFRVMKDYAYSSEQVFSADRWCLAGEAGVFLDPLYSPGLDTIAISNGLITDLIGKALDGQDVEETAAIHDKLFFLIVEGWMGIYEDQYPIMGNARVMTAKVVWDTAVYWAVPGLLYFHDQMPKLIDNPLLVTSMARLSATSHNVQRFFREWAAVDSSRERDAFIGFYDFDFMPGLHGGMTAGLSDEDLAERLPANVALVQRLSGQLVRSVMAELEADVGNEDKQRQVKQWREDEDLMGLVAESGGQDDVASADGWAALDRLAASR